ncbi:Prephenate dehydratase [Chloroherpeton thalassium ATCC 35110]|uniref:Prephenate dehydratase n=1 Tax=Chloroherpeton thalassium (strain ATCC 35110 / GB-78) TaxID=517418 RepID=B3QTP4_CHLT3|nr:prephenate dehydratase [Chloroherpeton thalassium]ACF14242.1 Prephenate dehydratase [Chloroherpeton thalassium ATCC 35110]
MKKSLVGYQGEPGAYSEIAALRFGQEEKPFEDFESIFKAVEREELTYGALPVENTLGGSIHQNYDLLLKYPVKIVAETYVPVLHCLMGLPEASIETACEVLSHPQALAQCRGFFEENPHLKAEATYDTAGSAKLIAKEKAAEKLAIASERAAELYGLKIFKRNLADKAWNITRFVCITALENEETRHPKVSENGSRKTSIVFLLPNVPGSLFKALATLALRNIDLTKIESRPSREAAFEYLFYVDFVGDESETHVQNALDHLREFSPMVKVLGSYGKVGA